MKLLFTFLLLLGYCALHAQEVGCGTTTEPFDIEDSTEVAKRTPYYRFDAAASLIYLQDKGYKLKESYLQKIQEDVPAIYSRFKKQDSLQGKKMENDANHIMARGSGMEYMEVRFWRHLDAYTNIPYVSEATFQSDITTAIGLLNQAFQDHDIPIRFYASCGSYSFKTTKYNPVSQDISKGDAGDVVDIIPVNSNHGLDVLYFAGKIMSSGESINFARFPWDSKNYRVAATDLGLRGPTIVHEVGHALGLYHTHQNARGSSGDNRTASGCYQESVSRTRKNYWHNGCTSTDTYLKCEINGDQISDTHASFKALEDYTSGGFYNGGGGTDNWGDAWTPPIHYP